MPNKDYQPPRMYLSIDCRDDSDDPKLEPEELLRYVERLTDHPTCDTLSFLFNTPTSHVAPKLLAKMMLEARGKYDYHYAGASYQSNGVVAFWYRRNHLGDV